MVYTLQGTHWIICSEIVLGANIKFHNKWHCSPATSSSRAAVWKHILTMSPWSPTSTKLIVFTGELVRPHNSACDLGSIVFVIKTINTAASEAQLEFCWSRCPEFQGCELDAILSNLETSFLFFRALSPAYRPTPRCFSCSAASNSHSIWMAEMYCFLLQLASTDNETECFGFTLFSFLEYSLEKVV